MKYFVNRHSGWPIDESARPRYALGEEFESEQDLSAAVKSGYLIPIENRFPTPRMPMLSPRED